LNNALHLIKHLEMQQVLRLCSSLNVFYRRNRTLRQGAILIMANLLIEIVVTLDERLVLFCRVLLAKVLDQTLQDWGVPRGVGLSHGISKGLEESYIVLAMLCHCWLFHGWPVTIIAFIQREVNIHCVVTFRPAGPELGVFTSVLSRFSEERDICNERSQAGTEGSSISLPYVRDIRARLGEELFPRHK
jgi:hypothetical protein